MLAKSADMVHVSRPGGLLTYCGRLVRVDTAIAKFHKTRHTHPMHTVSCPGCLANEEVRACAAEQLLTRPALAPGSRWDYW